MAYDQRTDRKNPGLAPEDGSIGIIDEALIKEFTDKPDFPYLVSFPRTGSHWLRMLMELYFEKPSLVRAFYFKNPRDFTCYHWHDEDLKLRRRNVIYLYRHPVPTIYSQLSYYQENPNDRDRVSYWSALYGRHLKKWLMTDNFTTKKTVVTYETLRAELSSAFQRICRHFDVPFNKAKLLAASHQVTKETLKRKTGHDQQVVNLSQAYERDREAFRVQQGGYVMETVMAQDNALTSFFQ